VLLPAEIKGIVKDQNKKPLAAVTVTVKNTKNVTITDVDGRFVLVVPDKLKSVVLVFDRRGYHPHEERVRVTDHEQVFKLFFISKEYIREKVSVTAMNQAEETISIPMAETSVSSLEIQEKIPENIMETLSDTAGVHFIGKGGYSVTPSIRGLARRRVLVLVDGTRITSDRRVGSSASFVPPELAKRIEVVRSAASVLYGSDAIGGVVNILTRPQESEAQANLRMNALNLNVNTINKRVNSGITYGLDSGKYHVYAGFQFTRAGDYSSPDDRILHSGYTYYAGVLDLSMNDKKRDFYLGYMGGVGQDVGKPERDNDPYSYSVVPSESDHIFRMGYNEKSWLKNGSIHFSLFLNPTTYNLDKFDIKNESYQAADTRSFNLGLKTTLKKSMSKSFSYQLGLEWFSRRNLSIENRNEIGDGIAITHPIENGRRNDYSMFLALNYKLTPTIDIDGGIRYTHFTIDADVEGVKKEKSKGSSSFFLGVIKKINPSMSLFFNVGRAFRFPSLSESFYTGITGRKYVVGNPLLEPESSFNIDTGLKISTKKFFAGLYFFSYRVNQLIERYKDESGIYTYDNIHRGKLLGGELELQWTPVKNLNLFGHYFYYRGRSDLDDEPLNDIPAPRLYVGGKIFLNRLWFEANFLHSFKKTDPGPAEEKNAAYNLLNLKGGYYLSSELFLYVKLSNVLNETYYANPDTDIPAAKGFNLSTGIHFYF
jgi:outer membrane receptor protein involved in Fe transport